MPFIIDNNKLKDYILTNISQVTIFAYYLNIDEADIEYCLIKKQNRICNPLRNDYSPSLGFNLYKDKLYMYDFANTTYRGDLFYIIGFLHGLSSKIKTDFIKICKIIIDNIILKNDKQYELINYYKQYNKTKSDELITINIIERLWDSEDVKLWKKWGISSDDIAHNYVYAVESFYIDDKHYTINEKCYAYLLGKVKDTVIWELYFPLRKKSKNYSKFITNNNKSINCLWELRKTSTLILTKSRKDAIVLKNIIKSKPFVFGNNYSVTHFGTETVRLTDVEAKALKGMYDKIYTFTDFDAQGIACGNYHRKKHGFIPIFLTNGRFNTYDYMAKDISDYVDLRDFDKGVKLVETIFNNNMND